MTTKVQNCDECKHFAWMKSETISSKFSDNATCAKGHTPRFILPDESHDAKPWGYRRKCEDFKAKETA